jgi:MFS family permease
MGQVASPTPSTTPERTRGTAAAALRNRNFRTLWLGLFASNIGTWMQTLVLPAYIAARTDSGYWVALFVFAQLGPLLLLSIPGGMLADRFPKRPWMVIMQTEQLVLALVMAVLVANNSGLVWILAMQLLSGIGNALNAPAMQGLMPNLVDPRDLPGVISLNSVMINGSRVLGPAIAAVIMARGVSASTILVINAVSYLFVIIAVLRITIPHIERATDAQGWANFMTGIRIARERSVLSRLLVGMALFSFLCLPYVGLFPIIVKRNFDVDPESSTYKWIYATWGLGACVGALAIGTVFAHADKRKMIMPLLIGFAISLAAFTLIQSPGPAFPVGFILGACYFSMATAMLTVLQQNLRSSERARVMSLWFMAFGGTVAIGNLAFGPLIDVIGARPVLLIGVGSALVLAWWCDVSRRPVTTLEDSEAVIAERLRDPVEAGGSTGLDEHGIVAGD